MKPTFLGKILSTATLVGLLTNGGTAALAAPAHQNAACVGSDYTVQANDWLSKIADKNYGDVFAYPRIVEATNAASASDSNYATIADANVIEVGWTLCIPDEGEAMMADKDKEGAAMADTEGDVMTKPASFNVTVENISGNFTHQSSGVFNTPIGADGPGPLLPGSAYEFDFYAAPGENLSMVSMLVQSNDWFVTFSGDGLALFDDDGNPVSGDVTSSLLLYDAGTEIDQVPGEGVDQAPRQAGPDTGQADPNNTVRRVADDDLPAPLNELVKATLEASENGGFTFRLENVSGDSDFGTPYAPGVWVVHTAANPIFTSGEADRGEGLEALAEDGNAGILGDVLSAISGRATPFAPIAWAVHTGTDPIFTAGEADRGAGLEGLAEDGGPATLAESLAATDSVVTSGAAAVPNGADGPGPLLPGNSYEFNFEADSGSLSFALMYVQSNDLFFAPNGNGITLFDENGAPISGDITSQVLLWDAGTEVNETPHFGPSQAPRQAGPNPTTPACVGSSPSRWARGSESTTRCGSKAS
ncbi:MAG: spondin domain-containing protein, partial [Chloroflexota bacterium]